METVSPSYVENSQIFIPHIENGVTNLGDLWNCRSSQAIGHNLFKCRTIPTEHLQATPIRNCDYTLTHVKNDLDTAKSLKVEGHLSLDLLAGFIKLGGNLKFQDDSSDKGHKEVISCRYINENYKIYVIPPIDSQINEHVSQLIFSREIEATHVVGGIMIGSSVTALIEISQTESKKDKDISGAGEGKIDIGMGGKMWLNNLIGKVSSEVKAHWSEKEKSENYDIRINCKARPMPSDLAPPSSVTQLFELIEKMPTAMTKETQFDINNRGIRGVPIQFTLYPIAQFVRLEIIKMYKSLEDDLMGTFQVMLSKAIEIQQKDYAKKLILMQNKELEFFLNRKSVLSEKVRKFEVTLKQIGSGFVNRSRKQLCEYKYGKCGAEEFNAIIQDFDASNASLGAIEKKIQNLINAGASEVSMVNGTDETHVKKFTNAQDKQIWKEDESNPKIILEIGPQCSKTAINGYYQLIAPLGEIGMKMALVMPSIAKELKLSLIIDNQEDIFNDSEVDEAIEILCANFRIGNQARAEFFAVVAAINGTEFPMHKNPSKFSLTLKVMLILAESYKHFKFADSVNESIHLIRTLPADHVAFCVPIDAPETALDLLQIWKDYKIKGVTWIVHSFECGDPQEAPLLFVILKSEVLAICLDRLDLLILEERIKETEKICDVTFDLFSTAQLSKSFHKIRASYAFRFLSCVFPNSIGAANQTIDKTETQSEVTDFLSFARKCLSSNELVILSSVAERVVYDFPNLISTLSKRGWNDRSKMFTESIFNDESGREMISEIERWLVDDSLIREIDQKVVHYEITDNSHSPIGFKIQLEESKSAGYNDSDERVFGILKELRSCSTSTKSHFSFVHVRIFLKALHLFISDKQSIDTLIKLLVKEYYENIKVFFPDKLIENYVQNKNIYWLSQVMSPYKYERWICAFLKGMSTICHLDDIDTLTRLIQDLSVQCTDINFTKQLWTNEKWLLLVRRCINVKHDNNMQLLRSVLAWVKKLGIECMLPDDIKLMLKSLEIVELEKLSSVEDVETFLGREIYERVNMPWYSTKQLTSAFQENPSLERELIEMGAAIHWDSNKKHFTADWSNKDMRQVLGKIKWMRISSRFQNIETTLFEGKERLFSLDMVAYILSTVHKACAQDLLEVFSKLSHPLPLTIPDIREKNKLIVTLPLLKNMAIEWHFNRLAQKEKSTGGTKEVVENHLFSSPFRLIAAVGIDGISTEGKKFFNQFIVHPYKFSSDAEANNGTLAGTVEFIWLTKETCYSHIYDFLSLDSHYSKNGNEILLLAYLHGSALDFPAVVSYLKKLASCFIVFQRPDQNSSFRTKMKKLETWLSGCPIVNVTDSTYYGKKYDTIMTEAMKFESNWKNPDQGIVEELLNTESIYTTGSATN